MPADRRVDHCFLSIDTVVAQSGCGSVSARVSAQGYAGINCEETAFR